MKPSETDCGDAFGEPFACKWQFHFIEECFHQKVFGSDNMLEELMFSNRSRLIRQLAVLAAASTVLITAEVSKPLSAAANPPPKPPPPYSKSFINWFKNYWKMLVPKYPKFPKQSIPKLPANAKPPKQAAMKAKPLPMKAAQAPQTQPRAIQVPNIANPAAIPGALTPVRLPQMKKARSDLTDAWLHVNAADRLSARKKTAALTSISQALIALGGATPKPLTAVKSGNHILEAEDHLLKAQKEVLEAKRLPLALKTAVLEEITKAQVALKTKAKAPAGKAAPPER